MGETVLLYSAYAILASVVAAMGFKVANSQESGSTLKQMANDLLSASIPGVKVILGTLALGLNPGGIYTYMQVVNGKTSVPQTLISWVQNWLSKNHAYDTSSSEFTEYTVGEYEFSGPSSLDVSDLISGIDGLSVDVFTEKWPTEDFSKNAGTWIIYGSTVNGVENYTLRLIQRMEVTDITVRFKAAYSLTNNKYNHYSVDKYSSGWSGTARLDSTSGTSSITNSYMARFDGVVPFSATPMNGQCHIVRVSTGDVVGRTGFEAGDNVPGKDIVIPGKGTGDLTNPDIVGWLQSAVGQAVASALGIGTEELDYVPVAVKNGALTGTIEEVLAGALENVIDQAQDVAQSGSTATDVVASGEKYANTSLAPSKPSGNVSASALYTIWNPTQSQLTDLASFLWSTDFVDTIKKILQSPMDALISLALFPVTPPTDGNHNIALGYIDSGVSARRVSDQFMTVQLSGLTVPHKYNSYLDYAPYTHAEIFLPFIGFQPLNINDVMGKTVSISYNIDLLSGVCTAIIRANTQSIATYSGSMAMFLPLSAGNWARMMTPIFGMVGGVASMAAGIGGVMGGAGLLSSTSLAVRGAESIGNMEGNSVSRSSSISGNAGIMGDYQPFIIVTRPISDKPSTFAANLGQTYNKSARIGDLSGFTIVEEAHIEGMPATDVEKQEIERLLKEGVIV